MRFFIFVLLLNITCSYGQFYQGGWRTKKNDSITTVTAVPLDSVRIFRISSTENEDNYQNYFGMLVDGSVHSPSALKEGGAVIVEGKDISILQLNDSTNGGGTWEVLTNYIDGKDYFEITWKHTYPSRMRTLIASFKNKKEFVLDLNSISNECYDGKMIVYIDGQELKLQNNSRDFFYEGSAIIGKGRLIEVEVFGNCDPKKGFYGTFRFKN